MKGNVKKKKGEEKGQRNQSKNHRTGLIRNLTKGKTWIKGGIMKIKRG